MVFGDFGVGKIFVISWFVGIVFNYEYLFIVEDFYVKYLVYKNKICEF